MSIRKHWGGKCLEIYAEELQFEGGKESEGSEGCTEVEGIEGSKESVTTAFLAGGGHPVGVPECIQRARSPLQFDVSSIPPNCTVCRGQ